MAETKLFIPPLAPVYAHTRDLGWPLVRLTAGGFLLVHGIQKLIGTTVTAFAANVPAGCDHTGKQAGRLPGWPNWASRVWQKKDEQKMLTASRYFDAMNFATRAKCPGLIGLGLVDPVCPAEGIFATCNQLQGPKEIVIMPKAGHTINLEDPDGFNRAVLDFLTAVDAKRWPQRNPASLSASAPPTISSHRCGSFF